MAALREKLENFLRWITSRPNTSSQSAEEEEGGSEGCGAAISSGMDSPVDPIDVFSSTSSPLGASINTATATATSTTTFTSSTTSTSPTIASSSGSDGSAATTTTTSSKGSTTATFSTTTSSDGGTTIPSSTSSSIGSTTSDTNSTSTTTAAPFIASITVSAEGINVAEVAFTTQEERKTSADTPAVPAEAEAEAEENAEEDIDPAEAEAEENAEVDIDPADAEENAEVDINPAEAEAEENAEVDINPADADDHTTDEEGDVSTSSADVRAETEIDIETEVPNGTTESKADKSTETAADSLPRTGTETNADQPESTLSETENAPMDPEDTSAAEPESSLVPADSATSPGFTLSGGSHCKTSITTESSTGTTPAASAQEAGAEDTASTTTTTAPATASSLGNFFDFLDGSNSPDIDTSPEDIEKIEAAAKVESTKDGSTPDSEEPAGMDSSSTTGEAPSPTTSGPGLVMNNSGNASGNIQAGHVDSIEVTQNSISVGAGAGGKGADESFTGKRYADKAFLTHLKSSLRKHPDMTPEVLETICELYSDYAETEIRVKDIPSLFAKLQERGDMRTDDIIYLQTLLWLADEKGLFICVAEIADSWEKDYEEIVSHLSSSTLDQGDDELKFLIHKKKEDVTQKVLEEWKIGVAKLMRVPPKNFKIRGVEEDFSGKTLVTTESPAVVCEALYKAMDSESTQETLEKLDVGKVAFDAIPSCQQEKVKVVKMSKPQDKETQVTSPDCQLDLKNGRLLVTLVLGNILQADADVIVTGEDPKLQGYGGVSKTLLDAGGEAFRRERADILEENGGTLTKGCIYTTKGVRNFCLVVHAILERRSKTSESQWTTAMEGLYRAAVEEATRQGYHRIAFPILGSGAARAPADRATRAALQGLDKADIRDGRPVHVLLCTKGESVLEAAKAEVKRKK